MKVPIGTTTIAGWATSALASLPVVVRLLETNGSHFGTPEQVSALIALVSFVVTQAGRYAQAHAAIKAPAITLTEKQVKP